MRVLLSVLLATAIAIGTWFVPGVVAQTTAPMPNTTAGTLAAQTNATIIAQNPTRRSIQICNTGSSNSMWIWSGNLAPAVSGYVIAPVTSNVTSCFTPPSGVVGSMGAQWNAGSASGTTYSVFQY